MGKKRTRDIDLLAALKELRALLLDKEDAGAGARLFYALGGRKADTARLPCVKKHPLGAGVLASKPSMGAILNDWEFLASLPAGSLGREYLEWARAENLSAAGLEAVVTPSYPCEIEAEAAYLRARGRDLHDLFHVLTGYGRDPGGEVALLAFTAIQNENKPLDLLSILGCIASVFSGRFDIIKLRNAAKLRAHQAPFLLLQDWASLIPRPIEEVRRELNLLPIPRYRPVRFLLANA